MDLGGGLCGGLRLCGKRRRRLPGKIYFDGSFEFPIATLWENGRHVLEPLILVEMGREAATIVMLAAAGILRG